MRKSFLFALAFMALLLAASGGWAQTPLIMPIPEQQFFTPTGAVCSGCFVYTYQSGNFTPQATYTDYTGSFPNTNPVVLNAAGFPETAGGAQVGIWLSPTLTYRIVLKNAAGVQLYQVDGITGQLPGSTSNPLNILDATCNQIIVGAVNFQTGLCFPAPAANINLTFPNVASDTMVARNTTDTLTNKTLTAPNFNGVCGVTGGPGTYVCIANASPTGTTTSTLTILLNAPSQATIAILTTASGVIGVCVSGCGNTGTAVIQQTGQASCIFDGATTAGDYVTISSSTAGDCHDNGASVPSSGQLIGQVLSTNASGGTYSLMLAGLGSGSHGVACSTGTAVAVNAATASIQPIQTCALPAGSLNAVGKSFRISSVTVVTPGGTSTSTSYIGIGTTAALGTFSTVTGASSGTTAWYSYFQYTCTVAVAGSSGIIYCTPLYTAQQGGALTFSYSGGVPNLASVNLTGVIYVGTACAFGSASSSNTCSGNPFVVEQLN